MGRINNNWTRHICFVNGVVLFDFSTHNNGEPNLGSTVKSSLVTCLTQIVFHVYYNVF